MFELLDKIRKPITKRPLIYKIINTIIIFLIGLMLGVISKIFDIVDLEMIHSLFVYMDLGAFFSRMSVWLLLALIVSVVSKTPLRASINTFIFFIGMLLSYYSIGYYVEGVFPEKVILFWVILACISPFLAVPCWYAKGKGKLSVLLSSIIISVFFILAFSFDTTTFNLRHYGMEAINWVVAIIVLHNNSKQTIKTIVLSVLFGIAIRFIYLKFLIGKLNLWVVQL